MRSGSPGPTATRPGPLPAGIVVSVLVIGALAVRAYGISERTFTHPEMHLPRIEVPEWASHPPPKDTLERTIAVTVARDVHPPGFYLLMWIWTGIFGTGLFALRIPLVVASAACVPLAYRLASRDDGRPAALLTAVLVAFHGHLIFFSQLARPWGWVVFFGLLSSVLLRELESEWSGWKAAGYVLAVAAGLWTEHTFWVFFAAHGLWIACRHARGRDGGVPPTLRLQGIAAALGSAALPFMWAQFGRGGYLDAGSLAYLGEIARLNRIVDAGLLEAAYPRWGGVVTASLTLVGGGLLVAGILMGPARARDRARGLASQGAGDDTVDTEDTGVARASRDAGSPGRVAEWAAYPLAALAPLLLYVPYGHLFDIPAIALASVLLAGAFLAVGTLACATWRHWRVVPRWITGRRLPARMLTDLPSLQVMLPVGAIFALSQVRPLLASRTFLVYTPFILLLVSRSVTRWARGWGSRVLLAAALVPLLALSVHQYETLPHDQHDYKALAESMEPFMRDGDLVVLRNSWWAQPMHYHLPAAARALPPGRLERLLAGSRRPPGSGPRRIWVVAFGDEPFLSRRLAELTEPLHGYRARRRVSAFNCTAVLFELDPARVR